MDETNQGNQNPETDDTFNPIGEAKVSENLTADSNKGKKENTRSKIAVIYIYAFFGTIACSFVIGIYKCFDVKDYIDFLIAISGILSGPLGFIIGYYFKASDN